jgi:hypothetical protein
VRPNVAPALARGLEELWLDHFFISAPRFEGEASEEEKLKAIYRVYGDKLGLPPPFGLKADVASRLDWLKRRTSKDFEEAFERLVREHKITSPIEQIFWLEWKYQRVEELESVTAEPARC